MKIKGDTIQIDKAATAKVLAAVNAKPVRPKSNHSVQAQLSARMHKKVALPKSMSPKLKKSIRNIIATAKGNDGPVKLGKAAKPAAVKKVTKVEDTEATRLKAIVDKSLDTKTGFVAVPDLKGAPKHPTPKVTAEMEAEAKKLGRDVTACPIYRRTIRHQWSPLQQAYHYAMDINAKARRAGGKPAAAPAVTKPAPKAKKSKATKSKK